MTFPPFQTWITAGDCYIGRFRTAQPGRTLFAQITAVCAGGWRDVSGEIWGLPAPGLFPGFHPGHGEEIRARPVLHLTSLQWAQKHKQACKTHLGLSHQLSNENISQTRSRYISRSQRALDERLNLWLSATGYSIISGDTKIHILWINSSIPAQNLPLFSTTKALNTVYTVYLVDPLRPKGFQRQQNSEAETTEKGRSFTISLLRLKRGAGGGRARPVLYCSGPPGRGNWKESHKVSVWTSTVIWATLWMLLMHS